MGTLEEEEFVVGTTDRIRSGARVAGFVILGTWIAAPATGQEQSALVIQQLVDVDDQAGNVGAEGCGGDDGGSLFTALTGNTAPPSSVPLEQRPALFRYCDAIAQGGANGWTGEANLRPEGEAAQALSLVPDEVFSGVDLSAAVFDVQIGNIGQRLSVLRAARRTDADAPVLARAPGERALPPAAPPIAAARGIDFDAFLAQAAAQGIHAQVSAPGGTEGALGFFINGRVHRVDIDANRAERGSDSFGGGVTLGGDLRLGDLGHAGLSFGYTRLDTDYRHSASAADLDSYALSAYGALYPIDGLYVDGIVTGSILRFDTRNELQILDGGPQISLSGDADGWTLGGSVGVGGELPFGPVLVSPFLRGDLLQTRFDAFTQRGGDGSLDLRLGSQKSRSVTSHLGVDVGYAISTQIAVVTPQVRGAWVHEYDEQADALTGNLRALPNARFRLRPSSVDRDYATLGGGVSATFAGGFSQFIDYELLLGFSDVVTHQVTAGLRWAF